MNVGWTDKSKLQKDENFKGSIFESLGFSEYLCPICGAHLRGVLPDELICLNACHLSAGSRERFQQKMAEIAKKGGKNDRRN